MRSKKEIKEQRLTKVETNGRKIEDENITIYQTLYQNTHHTSSKNTETGSKSKTRQKQNATEKIIMRRRT